MYAYDNKNNCFMKRVSPSSNYKPIVFYMVDGHMYLINDAKIIQSLSESAKSSKNIIQSSMMETNEKKFTERKIYDANNMTEALQYNDAIVYLPYADMCDEIFKYIEKYKDMPEVKCSNHKVVEINIKKKNLTVLCDPNIADGLTWKDVKARCDKAGIPFTNQSIGTLLMQSQREYFKPMRAFLMPEQKESRSYQKTKRHLFNVLQKIRTGSI